MKITVAQHGFIFADLIPMEVAPESTLLEIAQAARQKYGERAYAFRIGEDENWHYFGGNVESAKDILERNSPSEEILRGNITNNNLKAIIWVKGRALPFDPDKDSVLQDPK